jgi:hypothetical protein
MHKSLFAIVLAVGLALAGHGAASPQTVAVRPVAQTDDELSRQLDELLALSPNRIAASINIWSVPWIGSVDGPEVAQLADDLCARGYSAQVIQQWLTFRIKERSLGLLSPLSRLSRLAALRCDRPPTWVEEQLYNLQLSSILKSSPLVPSRKPPPPVAKPSAVMAARFCDTLGRKPVGDAVTFALEGLVSLATRGHADTEEVIPLAVEIASQSCPMWAPLAADAYARHFSTG